VYVIIVGGGRVGFHLAKALSGTEHEVFVIERDGQKCDLIRDRLGPIVLKGDGSEPRILEEAGARRADVLVAVTGNDEDNLAACLVAKRLFQVKRTIALAHNPENENLFKELGVDTTVSATRILMAQIEEQVFAPGQAKIVPLLSDWNFAQVTLPEGSRALGRTLQDLAEEFPPNTVVVGVITRDRTLRRPEPSTVLRAYEQVLALSPKEETEALVSILTEPL